jgi:uncharacterized membrane protein YgcG
MLVLIVVAAPSPSAMGQAQDDTFPNLEAGTRVYDETGSSLTAEQVAEIDQQLRDLEAVDANVIVMVRALDATPAETLDQVEALQQAWVAETGANQDNAVAILINRNPDDPHDARAGIYVGSTFDDGNVPRGEQEAIVTDALIPPLRDGDVFGSLMSALDRLETSIVEGPPRSALETWVSGAASSWVPWVGLVAALAGIGASLGIFRTRRQIAAPEQRPTLTRPGTLPPALAGALAIGAPQASAIPAIILDLATRRALAIEPESEGGFFSRPKIQIRLVDRGPLQDDIETTLWNQLEQRAKDGVVSSTELAKVAQDSKPVREALRERMLEAAWLDPNAKTRRTRLLAIAIGASMLTMGSVIVAVAASDWLPGIGIVPLVVLSTMAIMFASLYPRLTLQGQDEARPWKAYREGLKAAAKDKAVTLDLNEVLPDSIAMNLGAAMNDRLKAANEAGEALLAFTAPSGSQHAAVFPWWIAYSNSVATSSGSSSSSVASGGGAGGGGGAAGST